MPEIGCEIYCEGEEWHSPTNALDRFFMVGVEMAD